ncbi:MULTISPECIES: hypothetical protein [Sphingobacterium]|uniref:hypothetical protein n=1 Tax=Sphingobacterium TaxID=28453 RepID=UPI001626CFBF|nr:MULTISPECIES: hypothetical protein [Sphingobacterium]MBV2227872.1 hypothetical protein [Sphingobacterium mizutaii]
MKLTPLNITLACILVWAISEMGSVEKPLFSWAWLLILSIVLIVVDILFRLWTKNTQRLWIMQIGFILVVGIISMLIKLQF